MVSKRGAELPMNVIVIAVIALIVLILVVGFFMGGTSILFEKMAGVFKGGYDDMSATVQTCESHCRVAESLSTDIAKKNSAYCKATYSLDNDFNGLVDRVGVNNDEDTKAYKVRYYCHTSVDVSDSKQVPGVPSCDVTCDQPNSRTPR